MMKYTLSTLLLLGSVLSAPFDTALPSNSTLSRRSTEPTVTVKNQCDDPLVIGYAKDVDWYGPTTTVASGSSHVYTFPVGWSGRIWGRSSCSGDRCNDSGMGSPATLAEFHFMEDGETYYDISLVNGFNSPMTVKPTDKTGSGKKCTTSSCTTLPSCPSGFETHDDNGKVSGCKSACSMYNTDELCCNGAYNDPDVCKANSYTEQVEAACPDVYSYAYDDNTSVFICESQQYTVTFC
jgi:hypothetical protein